MYGPFDKQHELRDVADGAETATAAETGKALALRMAGDFKAVFYVTALDTANADETYVLSVETDASAAFSGTPVEIGDVTISAPGVYEVPLSGQQIEQVDPDAAAIRCVATLGGTTPSITYGCYLTPAA